MRAHAGLRRSRSNSQDTHTMLIVSNTTATVSRITFQHLQREIRTYECMERDSNADLLDSCYCLDAPSVLPAGRTSDISAGPAWVKR